MSAVLAVQVYSPREFGVRCGHVAIDATGRKGTVIHAKINDSKYLCQVKFPGQDELTLCRVVGFTK